MEESFNKLIKTFIIDFNLDIQEQETLKTFLITFRPFINSQAFNIITILADYSFIHLIAPKNQPVNTPVRLVIDVTDHKQDPFIYITTECYTPKEFYSIIINIGTFKKSTAGYRQYFAYKTTINNNIDINTMQTGAVNI